MNKIPYNIEAEEAVLGSILTSSESINKILDMLAPNDFYRRNHALVFTAMLSLYKNNIVIDLCTLTDHLNKAKKLEQVGGIAFITSLPNKVPSAANIREYARIVKEKAIARYVINTATRIINAAEMDETPVDELIDKTEELILSIANKYKTKKPATIKDIALKTLSQIEANCANQGKFLGLPTGFKDIDQFLWGLKPSDFIILAARPSMGKTAFALNIASYLTLKKNISVAYFSLEMSATQLTQRIYSAYALVEADKIRSGRIDKEESTRILNLADKLGDSKLIINDDVDFNILTLRSKIRQLKKENNIQLIIIDYLQLLEGRKSENRQQEVSDISRQLKLLARELEIPVIALSQLSRTVEMRQNKRPILSDLRESGSLEQDADIVAFLYRDDYYNPSAVNGVSEFIVAKNRNGATGSINLFFHKNFTRFADLVKNHISK